jgi:glutamate/tyrosine decarboxylase-like PLP-dependent enzyme
MRPVTDPLATLQELDTVLTLAADEARAYVASIEADHVQPPGSEEAIATLDGGLPEEGAGAGDAVRELARLGRELATRSAGPRFFHFVMGGVTPAALGADWLTSAFDQVAYGWASSPFASKLEAIATRWLRELFDLPDEFAGVLVTGATMANFTCLTAARSWWAEGHGVDADEAGLAGLPPPPILSSGYIHPSAVQAVGMLGLGRGSVRRFARDGAGRLDTDALERELTALAGERPIVIANLGEVNAGDSDPIAVVADLAAVHEAWLHVDGAFGLFARLSPRSRTLAEGVDRADSVAVDGHKWLNVPYDCGVAFVRDARRTAHTFTVGAPYLPSPDDPHPNFGMLSPENSRRARALAVWATLRASGRSGYRAMVERHLDLAQRLAARVDAEPQLERLADVPLDIVCFRWRPAGVSEADLDDLNRRLGIALLEDGRVFAGTTLYEGKVAFRPAIVNWRTREEDVDLLVDVLLELAGALGAA